jgi:hypothetical protein
MINLNVKIYYNVGAWVAILLYNEKKVCSQPMFERPNPSFERPTLGRWGVPWTAIISINLQFNNHFFSKQYYQCPQMRIKIFKKMFSP